MRFLILFSLASCTVTKPRVIEGAPADSVCEYNRLTGWRCIGGGQVFTCTAAEHADFVKMQCAPRWIRL